MVEAAIVCLNNSRMKVFVASALLMILLGAARSSHAEASAPSSAYPSCTGRKVSPSESDKAHAIYKFGKLKYDEGDYEAAVAQFREAYNRDCKKHELLLILSVAYERKGAKLEAARALEAYLERVPTSPDAAAHRQKIEALKSAALAPVVPPITVHSSAPAPPPPPAPPPRSRRNPHSPLITASCRGCW